MAETGEHPPRRARVARGSSLDDVGPAAFLGRLEAIFRFAPMGIGIVDAEGHTMMSNDMLRDLLGYSAEEFARMQWWEFTHPDDVAANMALFNRMGSGEIDHFSMEKRFVCKDGRIQWALLTSSTVRTETGETDYVIGMVEDISERKRLETELRNAEEHYRLLVERVPAVVYISGVGAEAQWHYVSPQVEEMLGFTPTEWLADSTLWFRQLHPDDRERVVQSELNAASGARNGTVGGEGTSTTYRMFHRDGRELWVRDDAMALVGADGTTTWHGVLVDVSREKQLEERLGYQAFHDALTGLPNRTQFHDRVAQALARDGGTVAVVFVDLDHFKNINDSFGHAYGDKVIVTAAKRIRACVRADDTAARLGGDEFALLVEGATVEEVEELAERILGSLRDTPMRLGDLTVTVGASAGVAMGRPGDTTDMLLRNADLAMYQAKRQGRGLHFRYHDELHDVVVSRFRVEEALHTAVQDGSIGVVYQPIVDIRSGSVAGLEALARWTDPRLGVVPPSRFIPTAERTGLIKRLGEQVLRTASHDLATWRSRGHDAYLSVNVSPLQLDEDFPAVVQAALQLSGVPPTALVVEVTEGVMLHERSRRPLQELRSGGVRVAIDDFGTGYSSLSYLLDLPVDIIKIDRHFLRRGAGVSEDQTVLHALIGLADSLGLVSVCEGVEDHAQLADLQSTRCTLAQGFYLGSPTCLDDVPGQVDVTTTALL